MFVGTWAVSKLQPAQRAARGAWVVMESCVQPQGSDWLSFATDRESSKEVIDISILLVQLSLWQFHLKWWAIDCMLMMVEGFLSWAICTVGESCSAGWCLLFWCRACCLGSGRQKLHCRNRLTQRFPVVLMWQVSVLACRKSNPGPAAEALTHLINYIVLRRVQERERKTWALKCWCSVRGP